MAYQSQPMKKSYTLDWKAKIKLKPLPGVGPKKRAVAVWVSQGKNPIPVQVVGRYYPGEDAESKPKKTAVAAPAKTKSETKYGAALARG